MASKVSAENVFGQVLICLRMSRLDFLVTETPYAAYVTVRKKFMKSVNVQKDIFEVDNVEMNTKENAQLKQKVKDLETNCALIRFENEELDIKNESLKRDITSLDDKLEEVYLESRNYKESFRLTKIENDKLSESLSEKVAENANLQEAFEKFKVANRKTAKAQTELEETIIMLENVVETRDQKIYTLKEELNSMEETLPASFTPNCERCENAADLNKDSKIHDTIVHTDDNLPSTSKCGTCEYESDDETDLKMHMKSEHEPHWYKCDTCDLAFKTKLKLKDHICRVEIKIQHLVIFI